MVPEEAASIQEAIETGLDTVLVQPGSYAETVVVRDGVVLRNGSAGAIPVMIDGFYLDLTYHAPTGRPVVVVGITVSGPVILKNEFTPCDITFDSCRLSGGVTDVSTGLETWMLVVRRTTITGDAQLYARGVIAEADSVAGQMLVRSDGKFRVTRCVVQGPGTYGIYGRSEDGGVVDSNTVAGFEHGIDVRTMGQIQLKGNHVADCISAVTAINSHYLTAAQNAIEHCGRGLVLDGMEVTASRNVVIGSTSAGIELGASTDCFIEGNVVGRSALDGIAIYRGQGVTLRANTVYLNGGVGLALNLGDHAIVEDNIGFQNGGAAARLHAESELICNDWFGNSGGAIEGSSPAEGDFELDPLFCNLASDDVHLRSDSPLLASSCGPIGALGEGCDVRTPTLVTLLTAVRTPVGVEIRWQITSEVQLGDVWVQRATTATGPWSRITLEEPFHGQIAGGLDRTAESAQAYWYRLVASGSSGVIGAPIALSAMGGERFGFGRISPNPGHGPCGVEFALAHDAAIDIAVFDVQGRCAASLAKGLWPAGSHRVTWSGIGFQGELPAGVYLLRYSFPGGQEVRRIIRTK